MVCRLALGTSDSAKSVPYLLNHFKDNIRSLAKFVDDSATRNAHLKEVQLSLQSTERKLSTVADTRWLRYDVVGCAHSHCDAVTDGWWLRFFPVSRPCLFS